MTDANINPDQLADLEARRRANGEFGEKTHTAAENTLNTAEAPMTDRQRRIRDLNSKHYELMTQARALDRQLREAVVAQMWEDAPVEVGIIRFKEEYEGNDRWFTFDGFYAEDGEQLEPDDAGAEDTFRDAASFFNLEDAEDHFEVVYDGWNSDYFNLDVSKHATRARLEALVEDWKTAESGRSSKEVGEDIDTTATRYISQIAAEHGWESIELDRVEGLRQSLTLKSVTKGGKTYSAGELDDADAAWAAEQFATPTARMIAENGVLGPFTLKF